MRTILLSHKDISQSVEKTFGGEDKEILTTMRNTLSWELSGKVYTPWALIEQTYHIFDRNKQRRKLEEFLANLPIQNPLFVDTIEDILLPMVHLLVQENDLRITVEEWNIEDALKAALKEDYSLINKRYIKEILDCHTPDSKATEVVRCLDESLRRSRSSSIRSNRIEFYKNLVLDNEEQSKYLQNVLHMVIRPD